MDTTQLGERVREARRAANVSQERLAASLGIPRSGISDIESGRRGVSASELVAIAKELRKPLDYFIAESVSSPVEEAQFGVRFRRLHLQEGDSSAVYEFEQACRAYLWIEDLLNVPPLAQPPSYQLPPPRTVSEADSQGEELATMERGRLALGTDPVRDPFFVIESQGIRVFVRRLETPRVTGIFHYDEVLGACILVNSALHPNRRAFDLMHEYCHVLSDRFEGAHRTDEQDNPSDGLERRANAFAASFLLPRQGVEEFLESRGIVRKADEPTWTDIFHLMVAFGASFQATVRRLQELDYLSAQRAKWLMQGMTDITEWTERFRKSAGIEMPTFDLPHQRRFGQLVLRSYEKEQISLGRVAELLAVDLDEARNLAWMIRASQSVDSASAA